MTGRRRIVRLLLPRASPRLVVVVLLGTTACGGTLDAGSDRPRGPLPVDERNPVIMSNDGPHDNWQGEYALLLASAGGPALDGIIVSASPAWPDIDSNVAGWRDLVTAARSSGLRDVPDPLASISVPLRRPGDGNIDTTVPNRSEGARFILDTSQRLSRPNRPMVVTTGGRLTDVADAYLIDHSVADRIVVVSSLGTLSSGGGTMGIPNGEMDPWANTIVVQKFRYVQVSAYYDQTNDVPGGLLSQLPANAFGDWIAAKQPRILDVLVAADQVSIIATAVPGFVLEVERVSQSGSVPLALGDSPTLGSDPAGDGWLVTRSAGALASARFWQLLLDPKTFGQ